MDKIIKEDKNFTWFETKAGMGYVASKKAFFYTQPERLSPEGFQRTGANQNIDPEYVRMVGGISLDLLGPSDSPNSVNK